MNIGKVYNVNEILFFEELTNGSGPDYAGIISTRNPSLLGTFIGPDNRLRYSWNDVSQGVWQWIGGPVIPEDEWVMTALVIEPEKATVYVYSDSGGLQSGVNSITHDVMTMMDIEIGLEEAHADRVFDGLIDDVRIYAKALSQAEILWLYTNNQ